LSAVLDDLRYAVRLARQSLGTTITAFAALTLGIGATTAMFSIINAVLLKPLPVKDPARLVGIVQARRNFPRDLVSMEDYLDWKRSLRSFEAISLYQPALANLTGDERPELVHTLQCDSSMLPLLGVQPLVGRNFASDETLPGRNQAAILSWQFWRRRFGGQNVLGQKILLSGKPHVIVGILPDGLDVPVQADIWVPLAYDLTAIENTRGYHYYQALGRLRARVSLAAADSELLAISQDAASRYPKQEEGVTALAIPFREVIAGSVRMPLLIVFGAVLSVLLIACVNVAHLLLIKASIREREIAIRLAVGASRARILLQLLTESMLLAGLSAMAGLSVAWLGIRLARTLQNTPLTHPENITLDRQVMLFAMALGAATGIFFGCFPALRAYWANVNDTLKQSSGRITESRSQQKMRRVFVFAETALATILLVYAILFLRSFAKAANVPVGFQTTNILTMYVSLPGTKFQTSEPVGAFADDMVKRISPMPGVAALAFSNYLPLLAPPGGGPILVQGQPQHWGVSTAPTVVVTSVTSGYFHTLGIPLRSGRLFEDSDSKPQVATIIINQKLADTYFPGANPIGHRISFYTDPLNWKEIVGVVADVHETGLESPEMPQMYVPLAHLPMARLPVVRLSLLVRTAGAPLGYARAVEREIRSMDPDLPVLSIRTMDEIVSGQLGWRAVQTSLLALFAGVALLLTSIGIYATIAYSVSQRVTEIGVRMTVGAGQGDILKMVLSQGAGPAILGTFTGIAGALLSGRVLSTLLYGTQATDWLTYTIVGPTLIAVALAASYFPARRAAAVEPWKALRYE